MEVNGTLCVDCKNKLLSVATAVIPHCLNTPTFLADRCAPGAQSEAPVGRSTMMVLELAKREVARTGHARVDAEAISRA